MQGYALVCDLQEIRDSVEPLSSEDVPQGSARKGTATMRKTSHRTNGLLANEPTHEKECARAPSLECSRRSGF